MAVSTKVYTRFLFPYILLHSLSPYIFLSNRANHSHFRFVSLVLIWWYLISLVSDLEMNAVYGPT